MPDRRERSGADSHGLDEGPTAWLLHEYERFRQRRYAPLATLTLVVVGLAVLPELLGVTVLGVSVGTVLSVHILIIALVWATAAQAWNLISGFGGQFSFGHAAFFGIGAYVPIVLIREFAVNPWVGMLAGGVIAGLYGLLMGGLCFRYRLRGNYFTLATLAFAELLRHVFINLPALGGASGYVRPLPRVYAPDYGLVAFQFRDNRPYYYVILGFLALVSLVALVVKQSQLGLHLAAIRDDEDAALAVGVPAVRYKLVALAASGFFTAWAGTFWAMYFTSIRPNVVFDLLVNIDILLPAIVGGLGTVIGPIAGSLALTFASEVARHAVDVSGLENLVYGLFLFAIVFYSPAGVSSWPGSLVTSLRRSGQRLRGRALSRAANGGANGRAGRSISSVAAGGTRRFVEALWSRRYRPPPGKPPQPSDPDEVPGPAREPSTHRTMDTNPDPTEPVLKGDGDDRLPPDDVPRHWLEFEDTVRLRVTEATLRAVLSDPDELASCLPGVEEITATPDGTYACTITQSISGITHLVLEMTAEFETARTDASAPVVIEGTAHDPDTATELTVSAAVQTTNADCGVVELSYTADVSLRSYNASVSPAVLAPTVRESLDRAFERIETAAANRGDGPTSCH